jgi:anti-anti-sigma factor
MQTLPWFHIRHLKGADVLTFTRPDIWQDDEVRRAGDEMFRLAESPGHRRFVLHLGQVHCLSSAMLGKLIAFDRKVKQAGGELTLCSLASDLSATFDRMRLDRVFRICPTEQEALGAP